MFPKLEEGGLATYRASLVQNQHLAILAGVGVSLIVKFINIFVKAKLEDRTNFKFGLAKL